MMDNTRIGINKLCKYQQFLQSQNYDYNITDELFKSYKESTGENKIVIRNKIVQANLLLVITFLIKKYNYEIEVNPVFDIDDVVQEASLLLITAIDKYDTSRGSFSTYIYEKLESMIYYVNGIANSPVNFSRGSAGRYKRIKKYIDLMADDEYISSKFNISTVLVKRLRALFSDVESYEKLIEDNIVEDVIKEQDRKFGDNSILQIDETENVSRRNHILFEALNTSLSERDRNLLLRIYGLDGETPPHSIRSLKKDFGYKGSLIYERQRLAIKKLAKNEALEEAFYSVDSDYDIEISDKTYYLQK